MSRGDGRYAEGKREAAECRKCGQPIWIVYHGPQANHTVEPRAAEELRERTRVLLLIVDPGLDHSLADVKDIARASLAAVAVEDGQDEG